VLSPEQSREADVADYTCYLLNLAGVIQSVHDIQCVDDATAITRARQLFRENRFAIWQGTRKIYVPAQTVKKFVSG
jgi:hypothetical protein